MLLFGSSLACVQTTPIACSSSSFASGDIDACACVGLACEKPAPNEARMTNVARRIFFITLPVTPGRLSLLHERFHAFVRILRLHQLIQVDVFLLVERGFDRSA